MDDTGQQSLIDLKADTPKTNKTLACEGGEDEKFKKEWDPANF